MHERVGLIGVGRMGGRMARRLLQAGFDVVAHDVDADALAAVEADGARAARDPAQAAAGASFVLCSLPTPEITEAALCGPAGALSRAEPGAVFVDVGTGDPATARRLAAAAQRHGAEFLDAPVSRGVAAAERGTLAMLVGGDPIVLERARPILSALATDIVHVGEVGAGQVTKLCNNMLAAINATALGEVLVLGVHAGVPLERLAQAIAAGSGGSYVLESYLPNGLFTPERPTGFALALMRKDIGLFLRTGAEVPASLPVSGLVSQLFAAAAADGLDDADWTSIAELYERIAHVRLSMTARTEVAA